MWVYVRGAFTPPATGRLPSLKSQPLALPPPPQLGRLRSSRLKICDFTPPPTNRPSLAHLCFEYWYLDIWIYLQNVNNTYTYLILFSLSKFDHMTFEDLKQNWAAIGINFSLTFCECDMRNDDRVVEGCSNKTFQTPVFDQAHGTCALFRKSDILTQTTVNGMLYIYTICQYWKHLQVSPDPLVGAPKFHGFYVSIGEKIDYVNKDLSVIAPTTSATELSLSNRQMDLLENNNVRCRQMKIFRLFSFLFFSNCCQHNLWSADFHFGSMPLFARISSSKIDFFS